MSERTRVGNILKNAFVTVHINYTLILTLIALKLHIHVLIGDRSSDEKHPKVHFGTTQQFLSGLKRELQREKVLLTFFVILTLILTSLFPKVKGLHFWGC